MKIFKSTSVVICALIASGCGSSNTSHDYQASSFSYKYDNVDMNGNVICTTGEQTATSQADLCRLYENHQANNYCQEDMRYESFVSDSCATLVGPWVPSNPTPAPTPQPTPQPVPPPGPTPVPQPPAPTPNVFDHPPAWTDFSAKPKVTQRFSWELDNQNGGQISKASADLTTVLDQSVASWSSSSNASAMIAATVSGGDGFGPSKKFGYHAGIFGTDATGANTISSELWWTPNISASMTSYLFTGQPAEDYSQRSHFDSSAPASMDPTHQRHIAWRIAISCGGYLAPLPSGGTKNEIFGGEGFLGVSTRDQVPLSQDGAFYITNHITQQNNDPFDRINLNIQVNPANISDAKLSDASMVLLFNAPYFVADFDKTTGMESFEWTFESEKAKGQIFCKMWPTEFD